MNRYLLGALSLLALVNIAHADPLGSAFTYQGELNVSNQPANGSYDFEIALYSVSSGGIALDTAVRGDVPVSQGLFSVTLDYTDIPFASSTQYYLELRVRDGASTGSYTTLLPRQPIYATPYAQHARTVDASAIVGAATARPTLSNYSISLPGPPFPTAGDSSMTTGVDGLPIASVYDSANGNLMALHCDDPACAQQTMTVLDSIGIVGRGNSIIVAQNGLPVISYIDTTNGALKLARCTDTRCTAATLSVVDPAVGDSPRSVILTANSATPGTVDVVYRDEIQGDVESASCTPTGSCTFATIDSANNVGAALDVIRIATRIFIAYSDATAGSLRLKTCTTFISNCAGSTAATLDAAAAAADIALVAPPDARLLILYVRSGDLRSYRCDNTFCGSGTAVGVVDTNRAAVTAILGGDGLPAMIALNGDFSGATFFKCLDYGCAAVLYGTGLGTSPGLLNARAALTLGAHGNPVFAIRLSGNYRLTVCDAPDCAPTRRR
ncbi:MAG: hypothetical protein AB7E72_10625 [Lysobacterales bacterium]